MAFSKNYKILSINSTGDEYIEIEKLFRSRGKVVRNEIVRDLASLKQQLTEQSWNACLIYAIGDAIDFGKAIELVVTETSGLVPVIVFSAEESQYAANKSIFASLSFDDEQRAITTAMQAIQLNQLEVGLLKANEEVKRLQEQVDLLIGDSDSGIAYISGGMIIRANEMFADQFGFADASDLDYFPLFDLIQEKDHEPLKHALAVSAGESRSVEVINEKNLPINFECSTVVVDNEDCVQVKTLSVSPQVAEGISTDQQLALHIEKCLPKLPATKHCLFYAELEDLHLLRAQYGHAALTDMVAQLVEFARKSLIDFEYIGQFGLYGLAILLNGGKQATQSLIIDFAGKVQDLVFTASDRSVQTKLTTAGAIELTARSAKNATQIIDQLLMAFDNAYQSGGQPVYFLETEAANESLSELSDQDITAMINTDIESGQFSLYYNPIINLRGSEFDFYEVLLGKQSSTELDPIRAGEAYLHAIKPSVADSTLDRWMIIESTKMLASRIDDFTDIKIIVNLSANALKDTQLASWLNVALKAGGIKPECLFLQFREQDINDNLQNSSRLANELSAIGIGFTVGDFGRANDPLKNIAMFKPAYVKLNDNLTSDLGSMDAQAIKALIASLNDIGVDTIVPNISQAAALAVLWQVGAKYIQGSYLADPMTTMDYEFTDIA